ncbi:uncharacterized protein LOC143296215 [Babylonia areolata]|uniref:uncharacterized protein LOC143296215 n=1 Tax=Babylonia areolata TaxID=304850 RepID=UPI003FD3F2A1
MMQRAQTSYDFYADRLKEDELADMPDMPLPGRQTPMGMVRPSSPGGPSRDGGHVSRPRSRGNRPAMVGRSNTEIGLQTESMRHSYDDNPFTNIDPINKHYYYRMWRRNPPRPQKPIYREGRLGSPWRHIKACINNAGNHLVFVDGTIKSEENYFYPPESMFEPPNFAMYNSPRSNPRRQATSVPATRRGNSKDSPFNERAKQGFKYWPHEQKPIDWSQKLYYRSAHAGSSSQTPHAGCPERRIPDYSRYY